MSEKKSVFSTILNGIRIVQSIIGTLLLLGLILFMFLILSGRPTPTVPDKGFLVIEPIGNIVEMKTKKDFWDIVLEDETREVPETLLRDIATSIRYAKTDERISGIVINMDYVFSAGLAQLHYIGQLLEDFKRTGKPVYAWGLGYSNGQYLVASHADEIYMHPFGSVYLSGYGSYPLYYREAIEKLKAKVHVFRAGEYKSLAEPYTRDDMSPQSKEANLALLNSLWADFTDQLEGSRGISAETLMAGYDTLSEDLTAQGGDLALLAREQGLVDGLLNQTQWENLMIEKTGENGGAYGYKGIGYQNYLLATESDRIGLGDTVAVVTVSGEIVLGQNDQGLAGAFTIINQLKTARYDDAVKAVVLRIDSPGGGHLASELIREEIELLKASGKPVVASMGSVAASGGYYVAAPTNEIWAQPTTITGSIGVIGMLPAFEDSLDAIGVHSDGVGTTPLSGDFVLGQPLSPLAGDMLQQSVESSYAQFLGLVAESRGLTIEDVDAIGQGRVWSGRDAYELGLVDNLGNFDDAVSAAAFLANVSSYQVVHYEAEDRGFSDALVDWLFSKSEFERPTMKKAPSAATRLLAGFEKALKAFSNFNDPNSVYMLCEGCEVRP